MVTSRGRSTARNSRSQVSYRESSTSAERSHDETSTTPQAKRRRLAPTQLGRKSFSSSKSSPSHASPQKRKPPIQSKTGSSSASSRVIESDGRVPPWSSLPFEILLMILKHASHPFRTLDLRPTQSISWLVNAARTCQAFKAPALTCLYENPPITSREQPHELLKAMRSSDPQAPKFHERKIKRLELDSSAILSYTTQGFGYLDLVDLVAQLPLLDTLLITDSMDRPPYRQTTKVWWTYPDRLFSTMNDRGQKLKSWHWNGMMFGRRVSSILDVDAWMRSLHQKDLHRHVERLSISNFVLGRTGTESRTIPDGPTNPDGVEALGLVLAPLHNLKSLSLTSCFATPWLPALTAIPKTLSSFSIINTTDLYSDDLVIFLSTKGAHLKHLVLNYNPSLDLRFLTTLGSSCPRLQTLHMDFTYYSPFATSKASPDFKTLMTDKDVPTWPSTLERLELLHLQKWDLHAAETFFSSLLNASANLPNLRTIVIKAILSIGWRDRAGFRDKWIGRLHQVFLRKSEDPNPQLASFKAFRLSKLPSPLTITSAGAPTDKSRPIDTAASEYIPSLPEPANQIRRTRRTRGKPQLHTESSHGSVRGAFSSEGAAEDQTPPQKGQEQGESKTGSDKKLHIQGLCTTVDITIDNLRPSEVQFTEGDFLDSERSGDEDWNSDAESDDDEAARTGYAW